MTRSDTEPEKDMILNALTDALNGWRYIRRMHGDLYGVGWDRVETGLKGAIHSLVYRPQPAQDQGPGEGWRWLERGEIIQVGDESTIDQISYCPVGENYSVGGEPVDYPRTFRRRVPQPQPKGGDEICTTNRLAPESAHVETPGALSHSDCNAVATSNPEATANPTFQEDQWVWVKETFPGETADGVMKHLLEEWQEFLSSPTDPDEIADVFLLLQCWCSHHGINLQTAAQAKFDKCKARKWVKTERGFRHEKEATANPPAIRLEVDKFYRMRNGEKVGPVSAYCGSEPEFRFQVPWEMGGRERLSYRENGKWSYSGDPHEFDIIAEWTDSPSTERWFVPIYVDRDSPELKKRFIGSFCSTEDEAQETKPKWIMHVRQVSEGDTSLDRMREQMADLSEKLTAKEKECAELRREASNYRAALNIASMGLEESAKPFDDACTVIKAALGNEVLRAGRGK
jgi:hypothetical protein